MPETIIVIEGEPFVATGEVDGKDTDNGRRLAEVVSVLLLYLYLQGLYDKAGRRIAERIVRHEVDKLVQVIGRRMEIATRQLLSGDITIGTWQARMANLIRAGNSVTASIVKGGVRNMRPEDWLRVKKLGDTQMRWLNRFAGQLRRASAEPGTTAFGRTLVRQPGEPIVFRTGSGRVVGTEKQIIARARSYATSVRSARNEFQRQEYALEGLKIRRVLTARESCAECLEWAGRGLMPAEDMAPIGSLLCGSHCRCYLETE